MNKTIKLAIFTLILMLTTSVAFGQTPTTAEGWKGLALNQVGQKNYADAITSFTNCIGSSPAKSDTAQVCFFGRGLAYHSLKKYQEAISDFSKSIEINPRIWRPYDWRGDAHTNIRKYEEAIKDYSKAIELNPNSAVLYLRRGSVYYFLGSDLEEKDYTKAIQLDPKFITAYQNRAAFYCDDGKEALAKADEDKIVQLGGKVQFPCTPN